MLCAVSKLSLNTRKIKNVLLSNPEHKILLIIGESFDKQKYKAEENPEQKQVEEGLQIQKGR
jgi:hypothetical protein